MNKDKLIEENMNLVYHVIHKYYPTFIRDEDVVQEGFLGLCQAADRYEEGKSKFSTYASTVILNQIRLYFKRELKHPEKLSLEYEIHDKDGGTTMLHDIIADEQGIKMFDYVERDDFIDSLTDAEQSIVALTKEGLTQSEIGERLGVSQQAVQQKTNRIKAKWRKLNEED
jgi:RNA polymerase sigma factor (sigma-70 family)